MVCKKTGWLVCLHKKARRQKRSAWGVLFDAVYENTFGLYPPANGIIRGKKHTKETILKKSGGNNVNARKVLCIETGKVFNSMKEASIFSGTHFNGISLCVNGKQKTAGGYTWKYYV